MMYIPRVSLTSAAPVQMGDSKLMVVAVGDGFEVVAADSFNRLFRPAEAADRGQTEVGPPNKGSSPAAAAHPWTKKGKAEAAARKVAAPVRTAAAKRIESSDTSKSQQIVKQTPEGGEREVGDLKTTEAMLKAVAEAPRTGAETQDRICQLMDWPVYEKKYRDRAYQSIWMALRDGKIEKRTDPTTQLSHLYLAGGQ